MSSVVEEIREEGRLEGWEEGRLEGWEEGRLEGRVEGRVEGREEGRLEGREEGRVEGRLEGREEGRVEGLAKGKMEGRVEEKTEIALQMLRMGRFPLADIAEITRMSLSEVRDLAAAQAPGVLESADRAEGVRAEKTATILQLVKMGGFTLESIAEITRLGVDEVREIVARKAG